MRIFPACIVTLELLGYSYLIIKTTEVSQRMTSDWGPYASFSLGHIKFVLFFVEVLKWGTKMSMTPVVSMPLAS